ncbi:MAG: D-aminoacyl-tRNA deacylase [Patescibacteria group bacterium]
MKIVLQRVLSSSVEVNGKIVGKIDKGFLILVGFENLDTKETIDKMIKKICEMRIFVDENNKMNFSILDISGEILIVSQFTLLANLEKGNRPSFVKAGNPKIANELFDYFVTKMKIFSKLKIETGVFGAKMNVKLENDGPVTFILES